MPSPTYPLGLAICLTLFSFSSQARGQTSQPISYAAKDIIHIVNTSRSHAILFNRNYKGKFFKATLPVRRISENHLPQGQYTVRFGGQFSIHNIICVVGDKATIDMMMHWRMGQTVRVSGIIDTTIVGDLKLKDCQYVLSPRTSG
jgi:uncharacterized ubiquitin-like protein YukD